jgi:uncharacterized protein YwqG
MGNPETIKAKLSQHERQAWRPVVDNEPGDIYASKFSGVPWLADEEPWPPCGHCGKPMQLFLQLNLEDVPWLPQGCPDEGLLQMFYCTNEETSCEEMCEAWLPYAESVLIRLVEPEGPPGSPTTSPVKDPIEPVIITAWEQIPELPGHQDQEALDCLLTNEENDILDDHDLLADLGDKLSGWPHFLQDREVPNCRGCGREMIHFFQIDSDDHLDYVFGDMGVGHISICPDHPRILAFGWAC